MHENSPTMWEFFNKTWRVYSCKSMQKKYSAFIIWFFIVLILCMGMSILPVTPSCVWPCASCALTGSGHRACLFLSGSSFSSDCPVFNEQMTENPLSSQFLWSPNPRGKHIDSGFYFRYVQPWLRPGRITDDNAMILHDVPILQAVEL